MTNPDVLLGAVVCGEAEIRCAVGWPGLAPVADASVPLGNPTASLAACARFFERARTRNGPIAALGVACFGPLQLDRGAPDYGCLMDTQQADWSGINLLAPLREATHVPVVIDTAIGAAARGEWQLGAGMGLESLAYLNIGTAIGGAFLPELGGNRLMHAQMGHLPVRPDPRDSRFPGRCPYHGNCAEGLAAAPAIQARWGVDLASLPASHPGRDIIAGYLGQLAATVTLVLSPRRIVIAGGVMGDPAMLARVRTAAHEYLRRYLPPLRERASLDSYLVAPALGPDSALAGAMLLARNTLLSGAH